MNDINEGRAGVPTPPALTRVEGFLNTLDERRFARHGQRHAGGDMLATEANLALWLAGHGLLQPGEQVDGESFALALALRRALREALAARAGQQTDPGVLGVLPPLPLRLAVDCEGGAALLPAEDGARGAVAALAADVAVASAGGAWSRLKMCGHSDCRWVFYDGSRNGLGRWCAMDVCGNRAKTRAYRERHAVQHGS